MTPESCRFPERVLPIAGAVAPTLGRLRVVAPCHSSAEMTPSPFVSAAAIISEWEMIPSPSVSSASNCCLVDHPGGGLVFSRRER